ncbi:MAG: 16S rRNA (uracil(1498)-N(3))-methyltransferase [Burkholderiaceae bacterium]|jgi:16S rRNA (uracil1498-N3)-methyltransferase|nr:16S rRNA (uracil(1498)-N(3))-methyltransferase [Burkholderiaceae bacterium]
MPRLYCNAPLSPNSTISLPPSAARHTMVLRLKEGETLTLFNGKGGEYTARIASIGKHATTAEILSFVYRESELPYRMTLVQGMPESPKMDFIIEKAVELGISHICPVELVRSVVRLTQERAERRLMRWRGIIISASEQSGRNRLAELADVCTFPEWIQKRDQQSCILLDAKAPRSLADWAKETPPQDVAILVGPEGGLTPEEESLAAAHGILPLSMGSRILRTETAGIAAASVLNALWS